MSFITNQLWMGMGILGLSGERVRSRVSPYISEWIVIFWILNNYFVISPFELVLINPI